MYTGALARCAYSPDSSLSRSSRGRAPPNIDEAWLVDASEFTGSFTVRGSSFSFGLPVVSATNIGVSDRVLSRTAPISRSKRAGLVVAAK